MTNSLSMGNIGQIDEEKLDQKLITLFPSLYGVECVK